MSKKMRVFLLGWFWTNMLIWLEVHKDNTKSNHLWQNQVRLDFPSFGNTITALQSAFITEEQNTVNYRFGHLAVYLPGLRNKRGCCQAPPCCPIPSHGGTLTTGHGKYDQSSDHIMGLEKNLARIVYNATSNFFQPHVWQARDEGQ